MLSSLGQPASVLLKCIFDVFTTLEPLTLALECLIPAYRLLGLSYV